MPVCCPGFPAPSRRCGNRRVGPGAPYDRASPCSLRAKINEEPEEGGYYYALYRLPSGPDGRGPNPVRILEEGRKNDPKHVRLRQELASTQLNDVGLNAASATLAPGAAH